jgi:hypothetical protein
MKIKFSFQELELNTAPFECELEVVKGKIIILQLRNLQTPP